LLIDRQSAEN